MLIDTITSDDTVFLQGNFISMAVGNTGTLGTTTATPKGFNNYGKGEVTNLGLYADLDGFGSGKASTLQDAVSMGAIIERFNIGYSVNGVRHVEGNTQFGTSTITNSDSRDLSDATAARAGWTGTTGDKLKVDQVMTLTEDAKYVKVEITLTNQSSAAMADLRYMRSVDPDQDVSYKNLIKVVEQGGDGKDGALIAAYQPNGNNPFFYYTADDRAKVSTYNMINRDPYADKAYDLAQREGFTATADQAVNINFAVGTLAAGAATKLVFYMGLTDNLSATIADIKSEGPTTPTPPPPPPPPVDLAPVAVNDSASTLNTKSVSGNVLANDKDPEGHALTASLVTGPANGTLKLQADGSFVYTAKAGFVGTDTFTYAASDGHSSDTARVRIQVSAAESLTDLQKLLAAHNVIDGSAETSDTLAKTGSNAFYFNVDAHTGNDSVALDGGDVLIFSQALNDGNGDGLIAFKNNTVRIDVSDGTDTLAFSDVTTLRYLGAAMKGAHVYANEAVRPAEALESLIGNDRLVGDARDDAAQVFFFDTALGFDLGKDAILDFGKKDILVTTVALSDGDRDGVIQLGTDSQLDLVGTGQTVGSAGHVSIFDTREDGVQTLEFDGRVSHDGVTYYVYSLEGSVGNVSALTF